MLTEHLFNTGAVTIPHSAGCERISLTGETSTFCTSKCRSVFGFLRNSQARDIRTFLSRCWEKCTWKGHYEVLYLKVEIMLSFWFNMNFSSSGKVNSYGNSVGRFKSLKVKIFWKINCSFEVYICSFILNIPNTE